MNIIERLLIVIANFTLAMIAVPLSFLTAFVFIVYVTIRDGYDFEEYSDLWMAYLGALCESFKENFRFMKTGDLNEFSVYRDWKRA